MARIITRDEFVNAIQDLVETEMTQNEQLNFLHEIDRCMDIHHMDELPSMFDDISTFGLVSAIKNAGDTFSMGDRFFMYDGTTIESSDYITMLGADTKLIAEDIIVNDNLHTYFDIDTLRTAFLDMVDTDNTYDEWSSELQGMVDPFSNDWVAMSERICATEGNDCNKAMDELLGGVTENDIVQAVMYSPWLGNNINAVSNGRFDKPTYDKECATIIRNHLRKIFGND